MPLIASFARLASERFGFLETSFGFRSARSNEIIVRWETDAVFVQVRYDAQRSYEVGLEIGQLAADAERIGPPYSLGELVGLAGVKLRDRPFFQASTEEELKAGLEQIACLLVQYGVKCLLNDEEEFQSLAQQRDHDSNRYAQERGLKVMRKAADKAWQDNNYKGVVELYRQQTHQLTPAERKRYEIALKRLDATTD